MLFINTTCKSYTYLLNLSKLSNLWTVYKSTEEVTDMYLFIKNNRLEPNLQ